MGCDGPKRAYYSREVGKSGKRGITFNRNLSLSGIGFMVPCQQCIGCRLEHSRQWAIRCMHEKRMHNASEFLTLTYDDDHLPWADREPTLVRRDPQLFLKRLRKKFGGGIKFYGCGEYGETTFRPHYHLLLFGMEFPDKKFYKKSPTGENLYWSPVCEELWPDGFNVIGDVTFESAAYCARYVTKKVTGDMARAHYGFRVPEFPMMSRNPGIGMKWFEKYGKEAYAHDSVIMNGKEVRPPRFYDTKFELVDSDRLELLKAKRKRAALKHRADNTPERRRVKEAIKYAKLAMFRREA